MPDIYIYYKATVLIYNKYKYVIHMCVYKYNRIYIHVYNIICCLHLSIYILRGKIGIECYLSS